MFVQSLPDNVAAVPLPPLPTTTIVTITVTATATVTTSITFEDNRSKTIELIEIEHCVHKFHPKLHSNARQSRKMISKMCTTAHETHIKWINGTRAQIQIDCTKSIAGGGDNINKTVSLFNNFFFYFYIENHAKIVYSILLLSVTHTFGT